MSTPSSIQLLETGLPKSNQGRFVRPTKRIEWNGLVFSTESELQLAQALDRANLFFLPATSCRITAEPGIRETRELDFMIVHRGVPIVVELDGRPHDGRAAEDTDATEESNDLVFGTLSGSRQSRRFKIQNGLSEP